MRPDRCRNNSEKKLAVRSGARALRANAGMGAASRVLRTHLRNCYVLRSRFFEVSTKWVLQDFHRNGPWLCFPTITGKQVLFEKIALLSRFIDQENVRFRQVMAEARGNTVGYLKHRIRGCPRNCER